MALEELLRGAGLGGYGATLRMCGCGVDDDPGRPIFCRVGSKHLLRKQIVPLIPPHTKYVEPFAGSSAIFFAKPKAEKNVLNDLDYGVVQGLAMLKNAPTSMESYPDADTIPEHKALFDSKGKTMGQRIARRIVHTCSGFSGTPVKKTSQIYRSPSIRTKVKHIAEFKEKLKDVRITSLDYGKVVSANDGKDTFFFLDPPYENTDPKFGYAEDTGFDFERLASVLRGIKGKFLMTINDSPRIRDLFKAFHQRPFVALTNMHTTPGKSTKKHVRKELYISNYKLP
jgi:DNA adenine methylase